jgi:hypothetical protein
VTADTVVDGEGSTQGWNRYSYVKNNPIEYKDPTGHVEVEMKKSWIGDVVLRTEGGKTEAIKESGLNFGHAAIVKDSVVDKNGNLKELHVVDLTRKGVQDRIITSSGSYIVDEKGKRTLDDKNETINQYRSFRVGTKEEGQEAVNKAESLKGKIEYDTKALLNITVPPKLGMSPRDKAVALDNKMVCSELVNYAYEGKVGKQTNANMLNDSRYAARGTTPDDIYNA